MSSPPRLQVVVPTYRRPDQLRACLAALHRQTTQPGVIVVHRVDDAASAAVVAEWPAVTVATVDQPGVLAAMREGVRASRAELVAFTDDDAEPRPDWAARLISLLSQPGVGAAGGRDIVAHDPRADKDLVGRYSWFGRAIGNHHRGRGPARTVDFLKGVNMGFRAAHLALPRAALLRGRGAEVHYEMLVCRAAQKSGAQLIYDPDLLVDHLAAPRHDDDARWKPSVQAIQDAAYNRVIATYALDPSRRWQWLYLLLVGDWGNPGVVRTLVAAARGEREVVRRARPSLSGLTQGMLAVSAGRARDPLISAARLRAQP